MGHKFIIFLFILSGCSSHQTKLSDLKKIAFSYEEIPAGNREEALKFIMAQEKYLQLVYAQTFALREIPVMNDACLSLKILGHVQENKKGISLYSFLMTDQTGTHITCYPNPYGQFVWDIYYYCTEDKSITHLKVMKYLVNLKEDKPLCQ